MERVRSARVMRTLVLFLGLVALLSRGVSATCTGALSTTEFNGLQTLYTGTGGSNWVFNLSMPASTIWSFPNNVTAPCSDEWQGLTCEPSGGSCVISSVDLEGFNLVGAFPTGLSAFSESLSSLVLSSNSLTGTVSNPVLPNLRLLNISDNDLIGTLPSGLFTSSKELTTLYAAQNTFTGLVPATIGDASNLEVLDLTDNLLSGSLPTTFYSLTKLILLQLSDNDFTGTVGSEIGSFSALAFADLSTNKFSQTFPDMDNATALEYLVLNENSFNGSLPSLPPSMIGIVFGENEFTGSIPLEYFTSLSNLQTLDVDTNSLSGTIPNSLLGLKNLTVFNIEANCITGTMPSELGLLTNLESFLMTENSVVGSIPREIGDLVNLVSLSVEENKLSGEIPSTLGLLTKLTDFVLGFNSLSGTLPPVSSVIYPDLEFYDVGMNFLTGKSDQAWHVHDSAVTLIIWLTRYIRF
jgi:Leucine-rich repeat (LRR) protein